MPTEVRRGCAAPGIGFKDADDSFAEKQGLLITLPCLQPQESFDYQLTKFQSGLGVWKDWTAAVRVTHTGKRVIGDQQIYNWLRQKILYEITDKFIYQELFCSVLTKEYIR